MLSSWRVFKVKNDGPNLQLANLVLLQRFMEESLGTLRLPWGLRIGDSSLPAYRYFWDYSLEGYLLCLERE